MDRERILADQTVLVEHGRIAAMGPAATLRVPRGATTIDAHGQYLVPGLADMHAHVRTTTHLGNVPKTAGPLGLVPLPIESGTSDTTVIGSPEDRLLLWLANGVTTVRLLDFYEDLAQDPSMDQQERWGTQALRLRARADSGQILSPRIYTAGQWGPRRYIGMLKKMRSPAMAADTARPLAMDSIASFVAAYKAKGYDVLKIHEEQREVIDSVMAAAKRVGMPIAGHVPNTTVEHVLGGYKSIEHPVTDYAWNEAAGLGTLAGEMHRAGVYNCVTQWHYDHLHYAVWSPQKVLNLKVLQDSGVKLLVGTDELPRTGLIARELQELVATGLTPYEALRAATVNVAQYFGTSDETGTIAVGNRADLVLLTGNPLRDIRYTAQPAGVVIGGRWLSRAELARRTNAIKLLEFTPGEGVDRLPLKSYWSNVVDEFVGTATPVFGNEFMWAGIQEIGNRYTDSTLPSGLRKFREEMNMFYGPGLQQQKPSPQIQRLRESFRAQRRALVDSLGTSDQYPQGTLRVVRLIAQQLGTFRTAIPETERAAFDGRAKQWLRECSAQGYVANIPGIP
jgi:imidazolonepropionase-like amidohydrolase